jgi:asparaginyl-tRNA synthetase
VEKVKDGQTAPGGVEVFVDYWKILGSAPGGADSFEGRLREVSQVLALSIPNNRR